MSNTSLIEEIKWKFDKLYESEPDIYFAPGRINLIGEHVDYNDGFVLPTAIDKGIYFAVLPNRTKLVRLFAYNLGEYADFSLDELEPDNVQWTNYFKGITHFISSQYDIGGFDCVFSSDLPVGAGLSSSAALTCGIGYAISKMFKLGIDKIELAKMAQLTEHKFAGVKCGIMDQFASLMSKRDQIIRLDCNSLEHSYFPLHLKDYDIVLFNTKVTHQLSFTEYNKRREECERALAFFKQVLPSVESFRDLDPHIVSFFEHSLNEQEYKRALYITQEIQRTLLASDFLVEGKIEAFGECMFQTHHGLSKKYEVSCPELDFLVQQAERSPHVIGARLMGGGFGGCTINLIHKNYTQEVAEQFTEAYKIEFQRDLETYFVRPSQGARKIKIITHAS